MRHHLFVESEKYQVAVLSKGSAFNKQDLIHNYVAPLEASGVPNQDVIAFTLEYDEFGKAPVKHIKAYLDQLMPVLKELGVKYLYVADANYFKVLAKKPKAEPHIGYVLPCEYSGYEDMFVVLGVNYQTLIYNPEMRDKIIMGIKALTDHTKGQYVAIGNGIVHSEYYPQEIVDIEQALQELHQHPSLTVDIEGFSLQFDKAGIGTITFCWDEHNGIAFSCDYKASEPYTNEEGKVCHGYFSKSPKVRGLLKQFFKTYKGKLTFHNAGYDVKVLIYELWMQDYLDTAGLLEGIEVLTRDIDDTKIIAYLATNSTAGNVLGLKSLAHEFAGNWAVEVTDIRTVPLPKLLKYNLIDGLSTHYVRKKYYPIMVQDQQEELYHGLMIPSLRLLLQVELTGMPIDLDVLKKVRAQLEEIQTNNLNKIRNSALIKAFNLLVQTDAMDKANAKLKTKQHPLEKFSNVEFNPNSGPQLQNLLYVQMGLPVLDYTDTKQPATGADTLKKLINHVQEPAYKEIIQALIDYTGVNKILNTFIPAFESGIIKSDGRIWLHGNFNIGGTVSGRLSSSDPNLQNIPANSAYGKLIKMCFAAASGWLFCGADFNSLEDYISALTTKDPNKLAVYEKGFDGHCLRAAYYFRDECPWVVLDDPASVNSLKDKQPALRQDSKAPTFLLTYGGTYHGMMSNLGWPEDKAKAIEKGYHDLYKVSDDYIATRLEQASKDGYVNVAFGLRLRTPLLKQVMWGSSRVPYEAKAEGRTAGNAMGQSYGLLNNRAAVAFMKKVWASKYRLDIKPVALIHDAIYILVRDDPEVLTWANKNLIDEMRWQELPEIQHPTVKLGAALDVFWPNWSNNITLPNDASEDEIIQACIKGKAKYEEKANKK